MSDSTMNPTLPAADPESSEFPMPRILLVDDSSTVRIFVSGILSRAGYKILAADTARSGLQLFAAHRPDVVLLDVGLPDAEPAQTIEQMRACTVNDDRDATILLYSGEPATLLQQLQADIGADGWVTKNHDAEGLLQRLERTLLARRPS